MIKNKAKCNLEFIKKTCSFNDLTALKTLLLSHSFRPRILPFDLFRNNTSKQNETIESVENIFLRFISFKFNKSRPIHGLYHSLLNFLNLSPLDIRYSILLSKF